MSARLTAGMLVSALIRRIEAAGGHAMVLAKGDADSGTILLAIADRGAIAKLIERMPTLAEGHAWLPVGPPSFDDPGVLTDYLARRRRSDPDLWAIELDHPDAESIALATLA